MNIKIYNDRPEKIKFSSGFKFSFLGILFLGFFLYNLIPALIIKPIIYFRNSENITIKIKNRERTCYSNSSCKYLVYTEDEVLENSDSWIDGKYDSADFTNNLDKGLECQVKVRGLRVPYFSWFRNITEIYNCETIDG
jgi:hypothetical protein